VSKLPPPTEPTTRWLRCHEARPLIRAPNGTVHLAASHEAPTGARPNSATRFLMRTTADHHAACATKLQELAPLLAQMRATIAIHPKGSPLSLTRSAGDCHIIELRRAGSQQFIDAPSWRELRACLDAVRATACTAAAAVAEATEAARLSPTARFLRSYAAFRAAQGAAKRG